MFTLTILIQHSFESPQYSNQQEKEVKQIQVGKEVKLSLFTDDMLLHIENPKDDTRKLQELINEFSKVADTKLIHRTCLFLH